MSVSSRCSTLTPCRSPTPGPPIVQPDHFYGFEGIQLPPSPNSDGKTWLDPSDDPTASRGIPVFKPTMEQFRDFEGYMEKINCWGQRSGIVKVIPPREWTESVPSIKPQLKEVKIKTPIEQHMLGSGGLFRQQNMEKRKVMSVREWVELCTKEEYRAPAVHEVGLESRSLHARAPLPRPRRAKKKETSNHEPEPSIKEEPLDDQVSSVPSPPSSNGAASPVVGTPAPPIKSGKQAKNATKPAPKAKRVAQSREVRQANLAERAARDVEFIETFEPDQDWLPHNASPEDYTPEFCQKLERHYWRNCGLGRAPWYGADTQGTLFTNDTTAWNVGHLPSALDRLLPASDKGLPGVNTPYLYFGMWRATFAWHVEDMDLYSINYIHFGAPKFWYAIPQAKASNLEQAMRAYFPKDTSQCHQFLRHKSFLVSPTTLAKSSCRPNHLVQHAGEFVITYPRGYHAGFNLGLNCAESVNFALECWIELGRVAKACECIPDSVRIDVDQLLRDRAVEQQEEQQEAQEPPATPKSKKSHKKKPAETQVPTPIKEEVHDRVIPLLKIPRKRPVEEKEKEAQPKLKKIKLSPKKPAPSTTFTLPSSSSASSSKPPQPKISVTLKLGPKPAEPEPYPCCLCVSMSREGLLLVHDPPLNRKDAVDAANSPKVWLAHELCASIIPETWVDDFEIVGRPKQRMVFGVDAIVKDRWNLKCSACTRARPKAHGAPVQCTKGKCPKAFHVTCAQDVQANSTLFTIVREVEKEVVLLESSTTIATPEPMAMQVDSNTFQPMAMPNTEERVLKSIKKLEVQILCAQHNPAVAAQKRASKQDKIKQDLLSLPSMSRVKIRVSSGVFEVTLIRVIEENGSVEVLWDQGIKREFKWGSVVFGSTDGPVLQKPSDANPLAVSIERSVSVAESTNTPVHTYPSVTAATADLSNIPSSSNAPPPCPPSDQPISPANSQSATGYPPHTQQRIAPYDYWPYATQQVPYGYAPAAYPYPYPAYYSGTTPYQNTTSYGMYPYAQAAAAAAYNPGPTTQYRSGGLQWQRPYQGPPPAATTSETAISQPAMSQEGATTNAHQDSSYVNRLPSPARSRSPTSDIVDGTTLNEKPPVGRGFSDASQMPQVTTLVASTTSQIVVSPEPSTTSSLTPLSSEHSTPALPTPPGPPGHSADPTGTTAVNAPPPPPSFFQAGSQELAALAQLPAAQLTELLSQNPQLRDVVLAALNSSSPA